MNRLGMSRGDFPKVSHVVSFSFHIIFQNLIYNNALPDNLVTISRLIADETSIFSTDIKRSSEGLNRDHSIISRWAFQWKMTFNPDPNNHDYY